MADHKNTSRAQAYVPGVYLGQMAKKSSKIMYSGDNTWMECRSLSVFRKSRSGLDLDSIGSVNLGKDLKFGSRFRKAVMTMMVIADWSDKTGTVHIKSHI